MQAKVRPCAWPPGPPGPSPSSNFQRAGEDLTLTGEEERKGDLPRELLKPFFVPFFEGTWPTFLPLRAEGVGTDEGNDRGEDRRSLRGAGKMPPPPRADSVLVGTLRARGDMENTASPGSHRLGDGSTPGTMLRAVHEDHCPMSSILKWTPVSYLHISTIRMCLTAQGILTRNRSSIGSIV